MGNNEQSGKGHGTVTVLTEIKVALSIKQTLKTKTEDQNTAGQFIRADRKLDLTMHLRQALRSGQLGNGHGAVTVLTEIKSGVIHPTNTEH